MMDVFEIKEGKLVSYNGFEKNIVIPEGVRIIGSDAFYGKDFVQSVLISDGVIEIEKTAFESCSNLKSVSFPSTLEIIGSEAFSNCNISKVNFPKNIKKIGSQAFAICNIKTVLLPSSLEEIGLSIFIGNPIEKIEIEEGHKSFKSIDGVLYNKDLTRLVMFPCNYQKEEFIVPEHVNVIGEQAFASLGSKEGGAPIIKIGENVKEIEDCAFGGSIKASDIYLSSSIKKIGKNAFLGFGVISNSHIYAVEGSYAYNYIKDEDNAELIKKLVAIK